ncbi:hypothetical protein AB0D16_21350 [Streptomyces sp. NPDC048161]|uniref:hypothetical protein n=1 Tax=unclassified Streptomyces TaxID=2593676 RepID=UPI0033EC22AF
MSFGRRAGLPDVEPMTPNVLIVTGRVTRAAVPGLCAELEALLRDLDGAACDRGACGRDGRDSDARAPGACVPDAWVDCDVGGVVHVDLALVEAVARLGLVARRAGGRRLRLRHVPPELRSLLDLVGLADVVDVGYGQGPGPGNGVG